MSDSMSMSMYVLKRNGEQEEVSFDKIIKRIQKYSKDLTKLNAIELAQQIIAQIFNGIPTHKIDELTAEICAAKTTTHPDYGKLASRITISNHHKNTSPSYSEVVQLLWDNKDVLGEHCPLINKQLYDIVMEHKNKINATLDYEKDFNYDYFGFKTLERSYLMRINDKIIERPQHLLMRVALSIHKDDVKEALKSYKLMSDGYFTHATPTLFNMGTQREQASSCFLLTVDEDSIDGIYKTIKDCAKISKCAGGIGVAFHKIRAKGSRIRGTNGISNGIVPMLKVFNETARYVDQCFIPGTIIYTLNGPKKIENIGISDMVLTSTGEYNKVNLPVRHSYNGSMLNIKLFNTKHAVTVTPEHQIMALKCKDYKELNTTNTTNTNDKFNFKAICNSLDLGLLKTDFYDANKLEVGDFLVYSVPQYVCDINQITEEDCRMYGILLSEGYINKYSLDCQLSLHTQHKHDTIQFMISYLETKGIKVSITNNSIKSNITILNWSIISPGFKLTYSQIYDNYIKTIDSSFIHLPKNKIIQILKGISETDGYIVTNTKLLENIRYMYLRLGILFDYASQYNKNGYNYIESLQNRDGGYGFNEGNGCNGYNGVSGSNGSNGSNEYNDSCNTSFTYIDYNTSNTTNITVDKSNVSNKPSDISSNMITHTISNTTNPMYIFTSIESITKSIYTGVVHDFEIDEPHDYTLANLGIVHNGGGKRAGSIACYIEPWHADIFDFLKLKSNTGIEEERARDLFYAMWIPDLFMKRVEEDGNWSLMCPDKSPNLYLTYGEEFEKLYIKYEAEGRAMKVVKARVVWEAILTSQMETGTPYIGFKDAVNIKNNQKNLGTIQSSNLCHEICEYTSRNEIAVCNLASIPVAKFLEHKDGNKESPLIFNYEKLREVVKQIVKNLNKVIDYNYYPVPEAEYSNRKNRPQGIGISSIADLFALMKIPFDSEEARIINRKIFENMYYAALECSMELARKRKKFVQEYKRIIKLGSGSGSNPTELTEEDKARLQELKTSYFIIDDELKLPNQYAGAYASFVGSPMSEGKFQFDLWNVEPSPEMKPEWEALRADILKHGIRNSLLIALMPTASTSQILGWNECIEPFTNNIYTRKTLAGTFVVVNKYLIQDLLELGIWNQTIKDKIIMNDGSVQNIAEIPQNIKDLYKTVWEMKQKALIDLAADRAPFVCQTQSMNLFVKNPTYKILNAMHFYSWKKGLKTGIYYLRSQAKTSAQKFSVDLGKTSSVSSASSNSQTTNNKKEENKEETQLKPKEDQECLMCSS